MQTFDPKSRQAAVPLTAEFDPPTNVVSTSVTFDYDTYSWYELTHSYPGQLHATLTPVGLACYEFLQITPDASEASFLKRGTRYLAQYVFMSEHHRLNYLSFPVQDLRHLIGYKLSAHELAVESLNVSRRPRFSDEVMLHLHDLEMESKGVKPLLPLFDHVHTAELIGSVLKVRGEIQGLIWGDFYQAESDVTPEDLPLRVGEIGHTNGFRIIRDEPSYLERPALGRVCTSVLTSDPLTVFPSWNLDDPLPANWPRPPGSQDLPGTITIDQTTRADRRAFVFGPASHVTKRRSR